MTQLNDIGEKEYRLLALNAIVELLSKDIEERSTKDLRAIAKEIALVLDENGVEGGRKLAKDLSTIGFNKVQVEKLLPLYQSVAKEELHYMFYLIGTSRLHLRDINIGSQRIKHLVKALKNHTRTGSGEDYRGTCHHRYRRDATDP